jgi:hypothetical protein
VAGSWWDVKKNAVSLQTLDGKNFVDFRYQWGFQDLFFSNR